MNMDNSEKIARTGKGAVELRRHGLAWVLPGLLVLVAPLTWGLSLVPAVFRAAQLWRSRQWVEDNRVVMERGVFLRKRRELALTQVEFVQVKPCLLAGAVDCGTLVVHGAGGVTLTLNQLAHPRSAQRAIQRALNAAPRCRDATRPAGAVRAPVAA